MRGADLRLAVQVQEGLELNEEDPLPLCLASAHQGEEQVHLPLLQAEPQATPPLGQGPQEGWQLEVHHHNTHSGSLFQYHCIFHIMIISTLLALHYILTPAHPTQAQSRTFSSVLDIFLHLVTISIYI